MACRLIPHLFRHSSFLVTLFLALFEDLRAYPEF